MRKKHKAELKKRNITSRRQSKVTHGGTDDFECQMLSKLGLSIFQKLPFVLDEWAGRLVLANADQGISSLRGQGQGDAQTEQREHGGLGCSNTFRFRPVMYIAVHRVPDASSCKALTDTAVFCIFLQCIVLGCSVLTYHASL